VSASASTTDEAAGSPEVTRTELIEGDDGEEGLGESFVLDDGKDSDWDVAATAESEPPHPGESSESKSGEAEAVKDADELKRVAKEADELAEDVKKEAEVVS
jgi:hypothetical protein